MSRAKLINCMSQEEKCINCLRKADRGRPGAEILTRGGKIKKNPRIFYDISDSGCESKCVKNCSHSKKQPRKSRRKSAKKSRSRRRVGRPRKSRFTMARKSRRKSAKKSRSRRRVGRPRKSRRKSAKKSRSRRRVGRPRKSRRKSAKKSRSRRRVGRPRKSHRKSAKKSRSRRRVGRPRKSRRKSAKKSRSRRRVGRPRRRVSRGFFRYKVKNAPNIIKDVTPTYPGGAVLDLDQQLDRFYAERRRAQRQPKEGIIRYATVTPELLKREEKYQHERSAAGIKRVGPYSPPAPPEPRSAAQARWMRKNQE